MFLVEWPSVIAGRIDQRHMELPPRVLVTAMQGHQRYFPLEDAQGALLPLFLSVSNGDPAHAEVIGRGNEDVLDARLQDAAFSFEVDREAGLAALDARLDTIVFHKRLGTMADKRERLRAGVADLAARLGADPATAATAGQAARWAKADQGAVLVAEFSDLQGYVAAEYARREGIDAAVATAIEEQYLPLGARLPGAADRGRGAGGRRGEGRQPRRRLRRGRGPHRVEGPLRPAPRRGRPGPDRPGAGVGHRPRPGARAGLRPADRPGRRPLGGERGHRRRDRRLPGGPPRLPARHRGRGGRGRRGRHGRGPGEHGRRPRPGPGRSRPSARRPASRPHGPRRPASRASRARRPATT